MAPRLHWKGYLKLSLVSCPIGLYPAVSATEKISFRHVNRETGHKLRQQLVDSVTGEVVEPHNKGRGYEVGENQFLIAFAPGNRCAASRGATTQARVRVEAERAESRRSAPIVPPPAPPRPIIENTRTIELDRFIPRDRLDPGYFNTPYYIVPRAHS
jgi:DNA end-binding protein Ku